MKTINDNLRVKLKELVRRQDGSGLLGVVAGAGVVVALVQGSLYYSSRTSHSFLTQEKFKALALQMSEAGIEENIADLGSGYLSVSAQTHDLVTYDNKSLGDGAYTTRLTAVGVSDSSDTVDVISTGAFRSQTHRINARLRVNRYDDTVLTPVVTMVPETTTTINSVQVPETTYTTTQLSPSDMPPMGEQSAYTAFLNAPEVLGMICHLNSGVYDRRVISVSKNSIQHHIDHNGDYVTTDGTCDLYDPQTTMDIAYHTVFDTVVTVDSVAVWDTVITVATKAKVQVLSWK